MCKKQMFVAMGKFIQLCLFRLNWAAFILLWAKKWTNKVYKLGKVDDKFPVDPGGKNKTKTKPRYELTEKQ